MHLSRLFKFSAVWFPALRIQMKLVDEIFKRWDRRYGGSMGPHCIEARNKEVREKISPERLLEFDVKQGWEPLCKVSLFSQCFFMPRIGNSDPMYQI